MRKVLILFIVTLFIGCNNKPLSSDEYQELLKQTILPIPDSLLTKEQLQLKIKLLDLFNQHISVENNCQKLSIEKKHLEKEGIPTIYYDVPHEF